MTSFTGKSGYSVEIIADRAIKETKNNRSYIKIPNTTLFKIKLENTHRNKCSVVVYIDSVKAGTWNIDPYSSAIVDRPVNANKRFYFSKGVFNKLTDPVSNIGNFKNTVVRVDFFPEYDEQINWYTPKKCSYKINTEPCGITAHVNTYHGIIDDIDHTSHLKYPFGNPSVIPDRYIENTSDIIENIKPIMNTDINNKITIETRLVVDDSYAKPFINKKEALYNYNMSNIIIDPKKIPKVRQYEDYFLINRYNPF